MSEIKRKNRRGVHQNISEAVTLGDGEAVRAIARYGTSRITAKAANIERHFIVKKSDASANNRPIVSERRPRKACPRSQVLFVGDTLVFITQAQIETQVRTHEPAILSEADVFAIACQNYGLVFEHDSLSQRSVCADYVDRTRAVIQAITNAVQVKAGFDLMRAAPEVLGG